MWRPARNSGTARVALVGDSITRGYYSSQFDTKGFTALLRTALQTAHGDGGSGFKSCADAKINDENGAAVNAGYADADMIVATGTWNFFRAGWTAAQYQQGTGPTTGVNDGPSACMLINGLANGNTPYAAGTLTCTVRGTTVRVFYTNNSKAFTVTIDGGAPQTVTPPGGATIGSTAFTGLAAGNHTIVLTAASDAAVATTIMGFSGENATGIIVNNFGRQGFASGTMNPGVTTFGHPADWSGGASYPGGAADLFIYAHGLNDTRLSVAADTFATNVRGWLKKIKEAGARHGTADLLFVLLHVGKGDTGSVWHAYSRQLRGIAQTYGGAFVDLWPQWSNNWDAAADVSLWGNDTSAGTAGTSFVHPGDTGHALYYNKLVSLLPALVG